MTRYKVQQFEWGFRTYDSQTEEPVEGEIARFDISDEVAEIINQPDSVVELDGGQIVATPGRKDPIIPYVDEQYAEQQRKADEYAEFLASPAGRAAQRYVYYMNHGVWPEDDLGSTN